MIKPHHSLCCFFCFVHFFILIHPSCASNNHNVTELVNEVCAKTSNYTFCVESLYSDPHTPQSDPYGLAYAAFGLAYLNATATRNYIANLLKKSTSTHYTMLLKRCENDYKEAVSAIEMAYNDLNSETFFELADLAGAASHAAEDCNATLRELLLIVVP